jgi:hypothetical protein
MKRSTLAILAALVCGSVPTGEPAYAKNADAAAQSHQFDFMIGDWNCTGRFLANPGHVTSARAHGERAAGGRWVELRYDEQKTASNPRPFHVQQYFRYDPASKRFMTMGVDSAEATGFSGISSGWSGDAMPFEESSGGKPSGFRDTFTRGANAISHAGTARDNKKNRWVKTDEEICHRAH